MFKTAAAKIAHNSTLPALGGNQDLRPLQDLITAEKAVLISLQKLSVDYSKASEALRTWGLNEGDDLGDILSASTTILNHFSSALSQYASHGHTMRDQLKAIRTKEEALEELKRRRRTVSRKADDADKKLSKMSPEHKNLAMQTELLNRLRDEIRGLDSDIMTEEAALADFKRTSTRMWMGLKFGGLSEMCEKGTLVAEFGKMIIGGISEEISQPGLPRPLYYGHSQTENYTAETHRLINEVQLSTVPSVEFRDHRQYEQGPQEVSGYQPTNDDLNTNNWAGPDVNRQQPLPPNNDYSSQRGFGGGGEPGSPVSANYSSPPTLNTVLQAPSNFYPEQQQAVDDFGMNARSAGFMDNAGAASSGGRFATFPVKRPTGSMGGYSLQDPSSTAPLHEQDQSLSASIAAALDGNPGDIARAADGPPNQPSWVVGTQSGLPRQNSVYAASRAPELSIAPSNQPQQPWGGRDPRFGSPPGPTSSQMGPRQVISGSAPLPPPPPGAALPDLADPWANADREQALQTPAHARNISEVSGNDALLAYMTTPRSEPSSPHATAHPADANLAAPPYEDEQQRLSRHVRFGEVQDAAQEMHVRQSIEKNRQNGEVEETQQIGVPGGGEAKQPVPIANQNNDNDKGFSPTSSTSSNDANKPKQRRVPPPTFEPEHDDKALDAAAAREVSRELEALKTSPPRPSENTQQSLPEPAVDRGRVLAASDSYVNEPEEASSLPPPSAPFAQRNASPHPYADLNVSTNQSPPYLGGYTAAQSYAQSYQTAGSYGSVPSSPAQAYAQAYQASSQDPHPTSTIPPRFQALNQETQIPPRFQAARSHSPGSPSASQIPPRFQGGGAPPIPPTIALPEQQESRFGQAKGADSTPYRTPPEYPRGLSASAASPYTRSASSLTTGSPVIASGARTISAAAFKRPKNTSVDNLGQADPFKKTLPSSPYPVRELTASVSAAASSLPPGAGPPGTGAGARKSILDDEEFDYISAYVNSNPGSPQHGEFEHNAAGVGAGGMAGVGAGSMAGGGGGGGYSDGRFTTDLDGSLR